MIGLSNNNIELAINTEKGFIKSLKYADKEYIGGNVPLFVVAFRDHSGKQKRINTYDMSLLSVETEKNKLKGTYSLEEFEVIITITLDKKIVWDISLSGVPGLVVEWVNYPQIAVKDDLSDRGGNSKILWGFNEGTLIEDMTARENGNNYFEPEYPCQGAMGVYPAIVETQFMAYYDNKSGLYFASHDKDDYLKGINFLREGGGIKLEFRHFTGNEFDECYDLPYPMVVEFFEGDWHDAAQIYRNWFKSVPHEGFIPIEQNEKLPHWYSESPVVITYPVRGKHDTDVMNPNKLFPYINVMPHVEYFEKVFGSKVLILLMHWEGTAPWAPPIVWPPYGGEERLKELVDALHERGDIIGVYCSGLGWTIDSRLAEYNTQAEFDSQNLKEEMCLSPEQELPYSNICQGQRKGYDLCPSRKFTIDTIKEQVSHMANIGIDYIQLMDQNHGGTSYFCYSRKHNHPPVPGKWQIDAVKNLLKEAQKNTDKVLFGCESAAAESYINQLMFNDNRFHIAYRLGRPVPVYSYIYHEYINNFMGNQVCSDYWIDYDKSPESFYERMAYSFSAGDMLTVVINEEGKIDWHWGKKNKERMLPNQINAETFVKNLNLWRTGKGKKYLHSGKMVKPLAVECDVCHIWRMNEFNGMSNGFATVPCVHTSAWQSSDGQYAQFLINHNADEKTCMIDIPTEGYLLHIGETTVPMLKGKNSVSINAFSAVMIEYDDFSNREDM